MYSLKIPIDQKVYTKLMKGKTVTVGGKLGGHPVKFEFTEAQKHVFNRLKRNMKNGKGTHLNLNDFDDALVEHTDQNGGRINKSIKRGFNKIGKTAEKAGKFIKKNAGQAVEVVKDVVPKQALAQALNSIVDTGVTAGLTAVGAPEAIPLARAGTHLGINSGLSTFYANDFSKKQTKKSALNALKQGAIDGSKTTAREMVVSGLKSISAPSTGAGYGMGLKPVTKPKAKKPVAKKPMAKRSGKAIADNQFAGSMIPLGGSFRELGNGFNKKGIPVY